MYNLNINHKILGFCYGLLQSRKNHNKMMIIIRILRHPDSEQNLWASSYRYLEPLPKNILNIPLNVFICKRLNIEVNESSDICIMCKHSKYYIGKSGNIKCFNSDCPAFTLINLDNIEVYNNEGEILYSFEYVEQNSELRKNSSIVAVMNCTKCNSCKQCTKKTFNSTKVEKCKRHKFCTHTKSTFRKKDMIHSLNMLSHQRTKEYLLSKK